MLKPGNESNEWMNYLCCRWWRLFRRDRRRCRLCSPGSRCCPGLQGRGCRRRRGRRLRTQGGIRRHHRPQLQGKSLGFISILIKFAILAYFKWKLTNKIMNCSKRSLWTSSDLAALMRTRRTPGQATPSTSATSATTRRSGNSQCKNVLCEGIIISQDYLQKQDSIPTIPLQVRQGPRQAPPRPHRGAAVLVLALRKEVPQLEQSIQGD